MGEGGGGGKNLRLVKRIEGLVDSSSFEVDPLSLRQETISGNSLSIEIAFSEVQNWDLVKGEKETYFM